MVLGKEEAAAVEVLQDKSQPVMSIYVAVGI